MRRRWITLILILSIFIGILWYWPLVVFTCLVFVLTRPRNKKWYFIGLLSLVVVYGIYNPATRDITIAIVFQIATLMAYLAFAILQFVAIFWFMAKTKVEVIRPGDPKQVTFSDYWGQPNLVKTAQQVTASLRDRRQYRRMGGEPLRGMLLVGPPGTGKTMLAKAMAGDAGVAFTSVEGSGFRAMFWGVDVLKMISFVGNAKNLAKQYGACIAFIDEIDAIGMSRGGVMGQQSAPLMGGGTGSLTRLLYEMDGIEELGRVEKVKGRILRLFGKKLPPHDWHVFFLGSTNRPDVLDPALTRPGRFDKIITVDKPTREGRKAIIQGYLNKVRTDGKIDVDALSREIGFATPAQIATSIRKDAVRLAVAAGRDYITQKDIVRAIQESVVGIQSPIDDLEPDQKQQIAIHEAGHAVATYHLMPSHRIGYVSIVRTSEALGYVLPVANYDQWTLPLAGIGREMAVSLMGYAATEICLGQPWTGASSDLSNFLAQLRALAANGHFGLKGLGLLMNPTGPMPDEMNKVYEAVLEQCRAFAHAHRGEIEALAAVLIREGNLTGEEATAIIKGVAA